jgi:hypothetical protein
VGTIVPMTSTWVTFNPLQNRLTGDNEKMTPILCGHFPEKTVLNHQKLLGDNYFNLF